MEYDETENEEIDDDDEVNEENVLSIKTGQSSMFSLLGFKEPTKNKSIVKPKPTEKKEEVYEGPRHIKVYGRDLFTINDPQISMEDIRIKIVNEYGFPEFSKDRTTMSLDKDTGIVVPVIKFEKKG